MTGPRCLINGRLSERVSVHDRGFQYGDGLFETIAVVRGRARRLERHLRRLRRGARRLGIEPPGAALLRQEIKDLVAGTPLAVLKLVLTRGGTGRGYRASGAGAPTRVLSLSPWPDYPSAYARDGVSVRFCRTRLGRNAALAGIKHLNRLEQILARLEWAQEYAEGLMLDERGDVIEGTMSNVFAVVRGTLVTPEVSACGVEGIMREVVLERAAVLGLRCRVAALSCRDIEKAQEIFLTNSLIGVWPVRRLETREYPVGPVTRRIRQANDDARGPG